MRATLNVQSNHQSGGLQIIQIAFGSLADSYTLQTMTSPNGPMVGFVDGGLHSPAGEQYSGKPYMYSLKNLYDPDFGNLKWNGISGAINFFDCPSALVHHGWLNFETYVVITNYNNSGLDKIVGVWTWGFNFSAATGNFMTTPALYTPTNSFSPLAKLIIEHDYPNYKVFSDTFIK
jgi:hypothetical protein